jgi:hypothetical protein
MFSFFLVHGMMRWKGSSPAAQKLKITQSSIHRE